MPDQGKTINALGRCESYGYCEDKKCPYYECVGCLELLRKDALSLIQQQQERIAELEAELGQRDYNAAVELQQYCERYEPTYNPEDGSM